MTINTTANRGYHWPDNAEAVTNGWDAIRDLAVDVDVDVAAEIAARAAAVTAEATARAAADAAIVTRLDTSDADWTNYNTYNLNNIGAYTRTGRYRKIGRTCDIQGYANIAGASVARVDLRNMPWGLSPFVTHTGGGIAVAPMVGFAIINQAGTWRQCVMLVGGSSGCGEFFCPALNAYYGDAGFPAASGHSMWFNVVSTPTSA